MRPKAILITAALVLAAAVAATAEVALDEVVQAGRFALYRDHADPHKYYYVPDAPRLATKRDGTPEFTFIKYAKTGGETKGGILHFLVTWGYSEGELASAESALRLKDPQAKIAGPVPFKEGTFKVVSATAGEGGIFSRRIVGEGKAPIMPNQKAAVSIALTEEGASLLWESFRNPTSDISVMYALKFAGVTPAFQAKLKVNWDKVYTQHDIKLHAEGTIKVVKLQADVRAILESLRQQGAIQLDVVGENESMQKMLDAVYGHLITLMCDKVPVGPGEATSPAVKPPAPAPAPDGGRTELHPAWSLAAVAGVVRAANERLRGGPFWDQDQVQAQTQTQQAAAPCSDEAKMEADDLHRRAMGLRAQKKWREALEAVRKAHELCPHYNHLALAAGIVYDQGEYPVALSLYTVVFAQVSSSSVIEGMPQGRTSVQNTIARIERYLSSWNSGQSLLSAGRFDEARQAFEKAYEEIPNPRCLFFMGRSLYARFDESGDMDLGNSAMPLLQRFVEEEEGYFPPEFRNAQHIADARAYIRDIENWRVTDTAIREQVAAQRQQQQQQQQQAQETVRSTRTETEQAATAAERRARREAVQAEQTRRETGGAAQTQTVKPPDTAGGGDKPPGTQAAATAAGGTKPPGTVDAGTKPPTGQDQTIQQAAQQMLSGQSGKPPGTAVGTTPPAGTAGQTATTPAAKPAAAAPEVKPVVSVSVGYSFKRVKMSGNYEVDMRRRLREDRDIVMSGNIGDVFQKYGEDRRFFGVVSLDDPTFQERSVEVILDGQDASDFKSYINAVSVLFRKQRFSGAPMTGEVKFVDQQFAQSGNRQSFKYGRLNEASTEWLDYEYKPKWSLYGGVEWEGGWTKTSDSVLTLTPPVRRRTVEISVDEDNILKNAVKALAVQIRHTVFGKDILKEVVINYDKGDPLQVAYTYMHEDGNLGYSYKVVWLLVDGREIHTDWMAKESPFIYAVYTKR